MRIPALLATTAIAFTVFTAPATARADEGYARGQNVSPECRQERRGNAGTGALLGSAIGAAAGAGVAGRGSRPGGALVGAALGAGIGALAGRGSTSCDDFDRGYQDRGFQDRGYPVRGYQDRGHQDWDYQDRGYQDRGGYRTGRAQRCHLEDVVRFDHRGRRYYDTVRVCD